jgi:hypothetical protein
MADFAAVGGHWVVPSIDSTDDSQVRMHVSIPVGSEEEFGEGDVDLALQAGDVLLEQTVRPGPGNPLTFVSTRAISAIAFFVFANPDNLTPTRATVTLLGESLAFEFGPPLVA